MKHRWLLYYQPGLEQLGKHSKESLYPFTKTLDMLLSILIQLSSHILLLYSHYKVEHPGEDLEDGQIMHKVNDGLK